MASLASGTDLHSDEKEYKLRVLEPADDCSSLASSNRSSIASDTDLMVRITYTAVASWLALPNSSKLINCYFGNIDVCRRCSNLSMSF